MPNLTILFAFLLSLSCSAWAGTNLLEQGGFECDHAALTRSWTAPDDGSVALDKLIRFEGTASLQIKNVDGTADKQVRQNISLDTSKGPRLVDVSLMMKLSHIRQGKFGWETARSYLLCLDKDGKQTSLEEINATLPTTGTYNWKRVRRLMAITPGTTSVQVVLSMCRCTGTAWFDDVKVTDATDSLARPEAKTATITVDRNTAVGKLSCGLGWNWMTVVPDNFSHDAQAKWPDLLERMSYNGDDWIRIGVFPAFFAPDNYIQGQDKGETFNYRFDNGSTDRTDLAVPFDFPSELLC